MADPRSKIPCLPDRIQGLASIAMNLSWRWHRDAVAMLKQLDPMLWSATRHNPVDMLCRMEPARLAECARDDEFLELYDRVSACSASWGSSPLCGMRTRDTPRS